jgi:hypothetical protein
VSVRFTDYRLSPDSISRESLINETGKPREAALGDWGTSEPIGKVGGLHQRADEYSPKGRPHSPTVPPSRTRNARASSRWLPLAIGLFLTLAPTLFLDPPATAAPMESATGTAISTNIADSTHQLAESPVSNFTGPNPINTSNWPVEKTDLNYTTSIYTLSPSFWGTTISARAQLLPDEAEFVNATPTQVIVWPGGNAGDRYDPIANLLHTGSGVNVSRPATSEAQFVAWCESIHCQAIFQVPGETDDPGFAAEIVTYTEVNLSFRPAYWEIGNEPSLWKHWGLPWSNWGNTSIFTPTPIQYAQEVATYITAMQAANRATPFAAEPLQIIGIPAAARSSPSTLTDYINATIQVNGPRIAGVAFHEYPAQGIRLKLGKDANETVYLEQFYGALNEPGGLPARIQSINQNITYWIRKSCPTTCHSIPVFVTEIGTALSKRGYGQSFSGGFPGAIGMTAEVTQAMALNVTNADVFSGVSGTANSWLTLQGRARPSYLAYTEIFPHLGSQVYPVSLSGFNRTLYGVGTIEPRDHDRSDLLVVNANNTTAASFRPALPHYVPDSPVEVWYWNGTLTDEYVNGSTVFTAVATTTVPVPVFFPQGLPTNWTVPPQALVLFEAYPGNAAPVRVSETGLPTGTFWFVRNEEDSTIRTSNASSLTLFELDGEATQTVLPVYLPRGERFIVQGASPTSFTSSLNVTPDGAALSVHFIPQWELNITSNAPQGSVDPAPQWWNASAALALEAKPAFGYVFSHWTEVEHLGANTTLTTVSGGGLNTTIRPNGSITLKAVFVPGFAVGFHETGLPPGISWGVDVHETFTETENLTINPSDGPLSTLTSRTVETNESVVTSTDSAALAVANGSYGFSVDSVDGYRSIPVGASFNVTGGAVVVSVSFVPAPRYPVVFAETGLPVGTAWTITLPNSTHGASVTLNSTSTTIVVPEEEPGLYGYTAASIPEYRAHPSSYGFDLTPPGVVVPVRFAPVTFTAVWEEIGLGPNLSWSVDVNGTLFANNGTWTTAHLINGTYSCTVADVNDYVATLSAQTFRVQGANVTYHFDFNRASFPVRFETAGLRPGASWSLRVANTSVSITTLSADWMEPNGSYTYNVSPPVGYAVSPSHGAITVDANSVFVYLTFRPVGPPPDPPFWTLALPALVACCIITLTAWGTVGLVGRSRRPRSGARH